MTAAIYVIARTDGSERNYIGSAVNAANRWATHRCRLRKGNHHSPQLQAAWDKHGPSAFEFAVLEPIADKAELLEREQAWLDAFRPHYNTCKTAGSVAGHTVSAEARAKISQAHKGRKNGPPSPETRTKIANALVGRPLSAEHRAKLAAAKQGKKRGPYSAEHRANIAAATAQWHAGRKA